MSVPFFLSFLGVEVDVLVFSRLIRKRKRSRLYRVRSRRIRQRAAQNTAGLGPGTLSRRPFVEEAYSGLGSLAEAEVEEIDD